ncbi:MAG TPA: hypothetical protein VLM38_01475 [Blastocatellia bacterium]|nr:hypothetical protein [Blastocatellia bacterium]
MTLAEAGAEFLEHINARRPSAAPADSSTQANALQALTRCFSSNAEPREITAAKLRDFLSRWYVEEAFASGAGDPDDAAKLVDSLAEFFEWARQRGLIDLTSETSGVLAELRQTLPRALDIARELSSWIKARRGAFNFPEFLTSFEQGGRSQYDIDKPGDVGAREGYFRIIRADASSVEAEDLISEERVSPVIFPAEVLSKLGAHYTLNLQLVRSPAGWEISDCGAVYPPGTDVLSGE